MSPPALQQALENRVLRLRLRAERDMTYLGALLFTPDGASIKEIHVVAGDRLEFRDRSITEAYSQFVSWKEGLAFAGRFDKARTADFERCLSRLAKSIDWVERLRKVARGEANEKILYDIKSEIQFHLGVKESHLQIQAMTPGGEDAPAKSDEGPADPAIEGRLQMRFALSAVRGLPLADLKPEMDVLVRFFDPADPKSSEYMLVHGLRKGASEQNGAEAGLDVDLVDENLNVIETEARVTAIESRPKGQLIQLTLPGDVGAYILEDEPLVKIKLPVHQLEALQAAAQGTPTPSTNQTEKETSAGTSSFRLPAQMKPSVIAVIGVAAVLAVMTLYLLLS